MDWKPYVPAAQRRQLAERAAEKLRRSGRAVVPVTARRGAIATTFWGKSWCSNLERYSDYANRLPRGRTYLRNGSVIDLQVTAGAVVAQVMGSSLYQVSVTIGAVPDAHWQVLTGACARTIDSWVELLQGRFSTAVMEHLCHPATGLFPSPRDIRFRCSCPDSAALCKHVAATLYGIGARLDAEPELLFSLRKVDAKDLLASVGEAGVALRPMPAGARILDASRMADVFGFDLDLAPAMAQSAPAAPGKAGGGKAAGKKRAAKQKMSRGAKGGRS